MLCFEVNRHSVNSLLHSARLLAENEQPVKPARKQCGFKTIQEAESVARMAMENPGTPALEAVDLGSHVSPRYWIIRKYQVGDPVSKTVNGDHYPVGTITHISPTGNKIIVTLGSGV